MSAFAKTAQTAHLRVDMVFGGICAYSGLSLYYSRSSQWSSRAISCSLCLLVGSRCGMPLLISAKCWPSRNPLIPRGFHLHFHLALVCSTLEHLLLHSRCHAPMIPHAKSCSLNLIGSARPGQHPTLSSPPPASVAPCTVPGRDLST